MKNLKKTLIAIVALLAALAIGAWFRKPGDPSVPFARVTRQTLSNTLSTNGKVEPIEYVDVRVEVPGLVKRLAAHQGDTVGAGQLLAELSQPGAAEDLAAAEARAAAAQAELRTLQGGGRASERAELGGNLSRLEAQRNAARSNMESLARLADLKAVTPWDASQAKQAVADLDAQIAALEQRQKSLVGKGDIESAEARVREAEAATAAARTHLGQNAVLSPMAGTLYSLAARAGAYLNAGDAVGSVGKLDPVRVRVYVDEPELGRVAPGETVRITWDALPGREWTGTVEKRPSEVIALGSRQVGEVLCAVANPNRDLLPGTNVNASILTEAVPNALTIPKTAVRREGGIGVYILRKDNTIRWQAIKTGVSDALRAEALTGVNEGDAVAQPSDQVLKDGMRVIPVFR